MAIATLVLTGVLARVLSRLSDRYAPAVVVAYGLGLSAAGHLVEWLFYDAGRWSAVVIYLHLVRRGGALALRLLVADSGTLRPGRCAQRVRPHWRRRHRRRTGRQHRRRTDRGDARAALGPPAAGGAASAVRRRRAPDETRPDDAAGGEPDARAPRLGESSGMPYVRSIATVVVLTSASTAIIDFLLKANATATFGSGPDLLRFFALFYGGVQLLSFLALTQSAAVLRRLGVSGALSALPGAVVAGGAIALVLPGWPMLTALRGMDAIVRNSLFRGGYELLFMPMDARTRNRVKAALDVLCDRVGEAAGLGAVQIVLVAGLASKTTLLLTVAMILAAVAFRMSRRFGRLYLELIGHELVKYRGSPRVSLISEAGWTLLQIPGKSRARSAAAPEAAVTRSPAPVLDAQLQILADLRSRDVARVTAALGRGPALDRLHIAQAIELLAWDEVLPQAQSGAERSRARASRHARRCPAGSGDGFRHPPASAASARRGRVRTQPQRPGRRTRRPPFRGALSLQSRHRRAALEGPASVNRPRARDRRHRTGVVGAPAEVARVSSARPARCGTRAGRNP